MLLAPCWTAVAYTQLTTNLQLMALVQHTASVSASSDACTIDDNPNYNTHAAQQGTGEDWSNISLTLSTAEPAIAGTPPILPLKTLGWKRPTVFYKGVGRGGGARKSSAAPMFSALSSRSRAECADECEMMIAPQFDMMSMSAPPPPPAPAAVATAGVIGELLLQQCCCMVYAHGTLLISVQLLRV
jgi:Domain of unknown function (DUF4139)